MALYEVTYEVVCVTGWVETDLPEEKVGDFLCESGWFEEQAKEHDLEVGNIHLLEVEELIDPDASEERDVGVVPEFGQSSESGRSD